LATPLGLLYDDVARGIALVTGVWFFLTPVIYPAPESGILRFNPVTPLLTTTRAWLTNGSSSPAFAAVTAGALVTLIVAWILQRLARPHVVARLG
jgi:lipopolysaccharide transport system permease protein